MADALSSALGERAVVSVQELEGRVGGGAAPERVIPSRGVQIEPVGGATAGSVTSAMLTGSPAVVARTQDDRVIIDLRTVREDQDSAVIDALLGAFEER